MYLCIFMYVYICTYKYIKCINTYSSDQNSRARIAICYSKLSWFVLKIEFGQQILRRSYYSSLQYKIKNTIYLEYYFIIIATQLP